MPDCIYRKPEPTFAPPYVALYPVLSQIARECGYALAIHGSVRRDFDLVAVPWVDTASSAEHLVETLAAAIGGDITGQRPHTENPAERPHGRKAWSIHLGGAYLDVSVMPLVEEAPDA